MEEPGEPSKGRIPFEPALEGLRGFALIGMLCFHSQFSWASGGFLPIATFFTLSGYLITSLFLVEHERNGRIRLGAFWARRFRRLMPASLLTLVGMTLFGVSIATPGQLERLQDDVLWALFYCANWHFLFSDASYSLLFSAPSPVQHFWSLAIEEQFYLAFPLVAVAGLRSGTHSRIVFGGVLATLTLGSVGISVWLTVNGASADRIYYGSDTRAAELLMGALLAVWFCGRRIRPAVQRVVEISGGVAMLVMVGLWATVDLQSQWLYLGGFAAYTLISVAVIAAAVQPAGPVRAFLSGRAIRWIGRVSYGAYLFHWPVYLWLSPERTNLEDGTLFGLRALVTFTLAGISYAFLESPIRTRRALTGWRPFVATPVAFAAVLLGASLAVGELNRGEQDAEMRADLEALEAYMEQVRARKPDPSEPPPGRDPDSARIAFYGDSTAIPMAVGLGYWLHKHENMRLREGSAELGCGIAREGRYRFAGAEYGRAPHCKDRDKSWLESVANDRPDIAVVFAAPWDVCDRKLPGDTVWRRPGDPLLDAYLRKEMLSAVDLLLADGSLVIWLTHPSIEVRKDGKAPKIPFPESDPARMARLNELIFELEDQRPGRLRVIDLARHMRTLPGGDLDPNYRPDGTHLIFEGALRLARDWLGEEVLRTYREAQRPKSR